MFLKPLLLKVRHVEQTSCIHHDVPLLSEVVAEVNLELMCSSNKQQQKHNQIIIINELYQVEIM